MFWWWSGPEYEFRITFQLPSPLRNGTLWDLLAFLIQSPADIHDTRRNDWDNVMNPQHFGSGPADIRIRIRINPEIWIRTPDHCWLRQTSWRRFALSEHSLVSDFDVTQHVIYGCWNMADAVTVATAVYLDSLNTTSRYQKDAARLLGSFIV